MSRHSNLFTRDFDAEKDEERERELRQRCTPETLLAFLQKVWRERQSSPTLQECKKEFGGILGPMFAGWELEKQGLLKNGKPSGV